MKMEGLPRYLSTLAFLYLNVISIVALNLEAEALLNGKVGELNDFVKAVETNSRNCSALTGCSSSCSRLSCYEYGEVGDSHYQCVSVFNNTPLCGQTCAWKNFDYSRSFVRLVDRADSHIAQTVCTQRTLDDIFKSSSMNSSSHFFRVFFGAVDGTTRIYPGGDEDCNAGPVYDPRVRPWYITELQVPKVVSVLIDSGSNVRGVYGEIANSSDRYLDKALKTARTFLDTVLDGGDDYINISSFVGNGTLKSANVTSTRYNKTTQYQPFNDFLNDIQNNMDNVVTSSSAVDISNAINTSINQLNPSSYPTNYLKVIIVLTAALSPDEILSNLTIPTNSGVNVFVYSFKSPSQQAMCKPAVRAFSEQIPDLRIDNPLYALESYYSFLAKVRRNFYGDSDIGYNPQPYPDFTKVDNNTLTISKAAFDLNGELLGVVGIDIFENKFGEQFKPNITFQDIILAVRNLNVSQKYKIFNSSADNTSVCFNPYELTDSCGSVFNSNLQEYLCLSKAADKSVGCCVSNCSSKETSLHTIIGGIAGGIVVLLVIAAIAFFTWLRISRRMERKKAESQDYKFPGPANEAVLAGDTKRTLD